MTPTRYVPTLTGHIYVTALKAFREMVKYAQAICTHNSTFAHTVEGQVDLKGFRSLHGHFSWIFFVVVFLFSAIEELGCDPPCTGNKVCRNYTGAPDCVCEDGFSGEDNCTGILDFRIIAVIFFIVTKF